MYQGRWMWRDAITGAHLDALHDRQAERLAGASVGDGAPEPGVLEGLLRCGAQGGVLVQQLRHKVPGLVADAGPAGALEVGLVYEDGLPTRMHGAPDIKQRLHVTLLFGDALAAFRSSCGVELSSTGRRALRAAWYAVQVYMQNVGMGCCDEPAHGRARESPDLADGRVAGAGTVVKGEAPRQQLVCHDARGPHIGCRHHSRA